MNKPKKNEVQLIEVENLYERYTGHRKGYRFKLEKAVDPKEEVVQKVVITCLEIKPKSIEVNVEVKISCAPEAQFDVLNFIIIDKVKTEGLGFDPFAKELLEITFATLGGTRWH